AYQSANTSTPYRHCGKPRSIASSDQPSQAQEDQPTSSTFTLLLGRYQLVATCPKTRTHLPHNSPHQRMRPRQRINTNSTQHTTRKHMTFPKPPPPNTREHKTHTIHP